MNTDKTLLSKDWVKTAIEKLPEVDKVLSDKLGIAVKLEIKASDTTIDVETKEFTSYVPQCLKPLFSKIWIAGYMKETDYGLWCPLHYRYEHPTGGSNGLGLATAFYQKETNEWLVRFDITNKEDKMKLTIVYNDSAISRTQVKDTVYTEEVSSLYDAFREVIETQGNEWEVIEDVAQTLDIDLSDVDFIEEVSDLTLEKYFIKKYNGDWAKAVNDILDEVDISGDRDITTIVYDGSTIRG